MAKFIKTCLICHAVKAPQIQWNAQQKPHVATSPFETIIIDTLGPYPTTTNEYIIIVEDLFTKWIEAKAVPNTEAHTVCRYLQDDVFARFGIPRQIISDNASIFYSNKYLPLCRKNNIHPYYTAIYFQRENPVERKVSDFKTVLRTLMYKKHNRRNWDEYISQALQTIWTRRNRATGETPAKALLGYDITKRGDRQIPEFRKRHRRPRAGARDRRRVMREGQFNFNQKTYPRNETAKVYIRRRIWSVAERGIPPTRLRRYGQALTG